MAYDIRQSLEDAEQALTLSPREHQKRYLALIELLQVHQHDAKVPGDQRALAAGLAAKLSQAYRGRRCGDDNGEDR